MAIPRIISLLVNVVFAIIGFLLGLRIVLRFFGANPQTPFVQWVYDSSESILAPFANIFPVTSLEGGFVLDFPAIFALIVYAFIGYLILEVVEMMAFRAEERERKREK